MRTFFENNGTRQAYACRVLEKLTFLKNFKFLLDKSELV